MNTTDNPIEVKFEELWEPWYIDERPHKYAQMETWDIPPDLVVRFKAARLEMEEVWELLRHHNPNNDW